MVAIVIPTYNEKDNILRLIKEIDQLYRKNDDLLILVADDNSPDGTGKIVQAYAKENASKLKIKVITKPDKTGLKDAYFNAFSYALKAYKNLDGVIQMDADLSHNPKYLKTHINNLKNSVDLSIGSRYVHGGGVENWSFKRKLLSRVGNTTNRLVLSTKIHDYTGGFNGLSRKALNQILKPGEVTSGGYYFLTEMKYSIISNPDLSVNEFPIIFTDRTQGESKMGSTIILEAFSQLWRIKSRRVPK